MADQSELTQEEQQYFETGGESAPQPQETPPAPEAPPETPPAEPEGERKTVPLKALHEERERRRQAEESMRQQQAQVQQLLDRINQASQPPVPDPATDPVSYFQQKTQALESQQQQLVQAEQQRQFMAQVQNKMSGDVREFAQSAPDYADAYNHLVQFEVKRMALLGVTDPAQVNAHIERALLETTVAAAQRGENVARVLYETAKLNGYQPKAPAQDRLQTLQRGQDAASPLSQAGGAPPNGQLSLEKLLEMSDEDFAKATAGGKFRELNDRFSPRRG